MERVLYARSRIAPRIMFLKSLSAAIAIGTGGPFGAAVFERDSGRLVAVGMNSVVRLGNSTLHGEMMAFMMAQHVVGAFSLSLPGLPVHELFTSCEPCAMCLGATLWSGVRRLAYGAGREDAQRIAFEEGPVFPASYEYLEERGIEIVDGPVRIEVAARKDRPDQRRAERRCGAVELVDMGVLGGAQDLERAAKLEIFGVGRPAVRRIEDQRHFGRLRVAAPQHAGDLEAHSVKLVP